jgi:hypothetical protein
MNEIDFLKSLTNLLFLYRKKKKCTITYLAKKTGHDAKFLRNLELGKHSTQINHYFKIAKELSIPINEITKIINEYYRE